MAKFALVFSAAFAMFTSFAYAADIKVFSGGAPERVLRELAPEFEKASGHKVDLTFQIVSQIQHRLTAGEHADLVLLPAQLIAETAKTVPMRAEGRGVLARVGIGAIVREGAARPEMSSADSIRNMLLGAKTIAVADPRTPTGRHLEGMFAKLGLADDIKPRLVHKGAIHGGGDLVAQGGADLGLYLVSEVQSIKGIAVVGLLPPALQGYVTYASAVPVSNQSPEPALAFLRFLTAQDKSERWKHSGFEQAGTP